MRELEFKLAHESADDEKGLFKRITVEICGSLSLSLSSIPEMPT